MLWENLRCDEFKEAVARSNGVCAIPIGCVEAHGIHLPLGCDTLKAKEFCIRAAEKAPVTVFPAMYFGEKSGAGEFPGTIVLPTPLIVELLEACCKEIYRNGFKKIVLVSSHGGNTPMLNFFNRAMLEKQPQILVYHYYQTMATPDKVLTNLENHPYLTAEDISVLQAYVDAGKKDGHGGFVETSCLYDVCPDLVALDKVDALSSTTTGLFQGFDENKIFTPFGWMGNYPNSYSADLHYGVNERIAKAIAAETVNMTARAFQFLREETVSEEYQKQWLAKRGRLDI